ncbi:CWC16 protein [Staphylotrichum tortipilum]|uniref:CWC16 protein n=1 Tax=Staphylotrichum tortipilum TaxID=2831512 RepID=A0AAN6MH09_9PEZI|nr:CWC16 protein [Staphylotrichum longicolle]
MQGFNMGRYRPPPESSPSRLQKKHPLGARASKLASHGLLTVRFELPFPLWCAHCPTPTIIGQGVRFNAAKRNTGESYHSTPIWSFTLRHSACGGAIEIRTDPKQGEYIVVSGARRREYGDNGDGESLVSAGAAAGLGGAIQTARERAEQREGAFHTLEKTIADRAQLEDAAVRIDELQDAAERQWEDPYTQNQRLRKAFRAGRHAREKEAVKTEELKERMGLGIELLPETEEDARRAGLVDFGGAEAEGDGRVDKALARPLFGSGLLTTGDKKKEGGGTRAKGQPKLKSEVAAAKAREALASEIVSNTRAARDPFLDFGSSRESTPRGPVRLPGLKRKRDAEEETPEPPRPAVKETAPKAAAGTAALVNYDSDSD